MKLKINGIERECTILPLPKNTFADYDSHYEFPQFVAFAPTIGEESYEEDVIVCPIGTESTNSGYELISPAGIYTILYLGQYKKFINNRIKDGGYCERDAAQWIYDDMKIHGIAIHPNVSDYLQKLNKQS